MNMFARFNEIQDIKETKRYRRTCMSFRITKRNNSNWPPALFFFFSLKLFVLETRFDEILTIILQDIKETKH